MVTYIDCAGEIDKDHPLTRNGLWTYKFRDFKEPPNKRCVKLCEKWIDEFAYHRKTFNHTSSSAEFKSRVEEHFKSYVAHGDFIQAALNLGYKLIRAGDHYSSVFAYFNMGFSLPKRYIYEDD